MFDFEFCLDTGDSKPICYCQLSYGIHERKIMNTHIQILEDNNWIYDCEGAWGLYCYYHPDSIRRDVLISMPLFGAFVSATAL